VSSSDGVPLTGPIIDEKWAAVIDAESRETAWLQVPLGEGPRLTEVQPGREWTCEGYVLGPGKDVSEVLGDNRLIEYSWRVERVADDELEVSYSAEMLQHVVLASFSNFTITLPLFRFAGAEAAVDGEFGGTIRRVLRRGPSHPSYWEGPASSLSFKGPRAALDMDIEAAVFTWVSLLDGRAARRPDTSLVVELYPAITGPHQALGNIAMKGTQFRASFTLSLPPLDRDTDAQIHERRLEIDGHPAPSGVAASLAPGEELWEIEPFLSGGAPPADGAGFAVMPRRCELPIEARAARWKLGAGAETPLPSYIAVRGPVERLRLKINGAGDCLDGHEVVQQLNLDPVDGRSRAEAVWRYAATTTYHMPVYPTTDFGEFVGSYGYGLSSTLSAMALVKLWGHAGLPARRVFLDAELGSAFGEVYYDGDWHLYDLADRTFYVDPGDFSVPSAEDLVSSPSLAGLNCDAAGLAPGGNRATEIARLRFENAGISYNLGNISFERLMRVSLRRGETLARLYRPLGVHAPSPREPKNYANAVLLFEPDLEDGRAIEGFTKARNCRIEGGVIVPDDPAFPASLEYRARSPYVIVGSSLKIGADPEILREAYPMISLDDGLTWTSLDSGDVPGEIDLSPHLVPGPQPAGTAYETLDRNFGFLLHVQIPAAEDGAAGGIDSFSVITWCQTNPALLPRLSAGENTLETFCDSWGAGAAVDIGWIEGAPSASKAYVGENITLRGNILNGGREPVTPVVRAQPAGQGARTPLGSWSAPARLAPGGQAPFELTCDAEALASLSTQLDSGRYDLVLEIEGAPRSWASTARVSIALSNRPDLVVHPGLVRLSPSEPRAGEHVSVTCGVRNFCPTRNLLYLQGAPSDEVELTLYERAGSSRTPVQTVTLTGLPPGSFAPATFIWTAPAAPGPVELEIVADPGGALRERDERNTATIRVEVLP
jgi:hypothetical protein